jgi:hypothetical protein
MTDEVVREKREVYEAVSDGSYLAHFFQGHTVSLRLGQLSHTVTRLSKF